MQVEEKNFSENKLSELMDKDITIGELAKLLKEIDK